VGQVWTTGRRFIRRRILHADDTPHRIALGVGLATFIGFTPTMGLQTVIALSLAALFRANKAVCIPFVWVTNPITFGPIYAAGWWLGSAILPGAGAGSFDAIQSRLAIATTEGAGLIGNLFSYDFWAGMANLMLQFGWELWIGCSVMGLFFGLIMYFATLWVVTAYRARRAARMIHRHARRNNKPPAKRFVSVGKSV